jgi:hypothetical protein
MAIKLHNFSAFDDQLYHDYWLALGKLMHQFSHVEAMLQYALTHFAGVSDELGRTLFGNSRVGDAKAELNRVLVATGRDDVKDRLEPFLAQLGEINSARNDLIHGRVLPTEMENKFLVTNAARASAPKRAESPSSVFDLQAMAWDLFVIMGVLMAEMKTPDGVAPTPAAPDPLPWFYKPAAQSSRGSNAKSGHNPKPRHQQRPSGK